MPRAYRSRKRRINTCIECHRKKQRCDRQSPCQYCIRRGTPENCRYVADESHATVSEIWTGVDHQSVSNQIIGTSIVDAADAEPDAEALDAEILDIPSQIGYQIPNPSIGQPNVVDQLQVNASTASRSQPAKLLLSPARFGRDRWAKYCEILSDIPEDSTIHGLINIFFGEANWYFTVLDRYYFDHAHRAWLSDRSDIRIGTRNAFLADVMFFPALLYQVIAIGVHFTPEKSMLAHEMLQRGCPPSDKLSRKFSDAGDTILDLMGRHHHSIIAVQADLMRCAWLKNSGHGAEAWYKLGNAIRQAQDIGLHLEPASPLGPRDSPEYLASAWLNEHKRRLWACLFTWESHMSLQLGRPRAIHARDCTISMPIDANMPQDPSRTLFLPADVDDQPSTISSQIVKYVLAQKIQDMMSLAAFEHTFDNYTLIQTTHTEIAELAESVPPALRISSTDTSWDLIDPDVVRHRLQISIIMNSFLMSLHRPHVQCYSESFDATINAAVEVLNLSQALFKRTPKHQHKTFTLIFYTIDAGILLVAMLASLPPYDSRFRKASHCVEEAIKRLAVLSKRNAAAAAGQKAITVLQRRLLVRVNATDTGLDASTNSPINGIPSTHQDTLAETPMSNQLDATTLVASSVNSIPQDEANGWDFLPKFDTSEDLLTAMTIDTGFTSAWLEQSLENVSLWHPTQPESDLDWIASLD